MELKAKYKKGLTTYNLKGRIVNIENDPSQFAYYKSLGLDVFKVEKKKKVKVEEID